MARKLRAKAGESEEKKHEQRMKPHPRRFRPEQDPRTYGERLVKVIEIQARNTEGEEGSTRVARVRIPRLKRFFSFRGNVEKSTPRRVARREKCHPETAKRCERPLRRNKELNSLGRGVPKSRLEAKAPEFPFGNSVHR